MLSTKAKILGKMPRTEEANSSDGEGGSNLPGPICSDIHQDGRELPAQGKALIGAGRLREENAKRLGHTWPVHVGLWCGDGSQLRRTRRPSSMRSSSFLRPRIRSTARAGPTQWHASSRGRT